MKKVKENNQPPPLLRNIYAAEFLLQTEYYSYCWQHSNATMGHKGSRYTHNLPTLYCWGLRLCSMTRVRQLIQCQYTYGRIWPFMHNHARAYVPVRLNFFIETNLDFSSSSTCGSKLFSEAKTKIIPIVRHGSLVHSTVHFIFWVLFFYSFIWIIFYKTRPQMNYSLRKVKLKSMQIVE